MPAFVGAIDQGTTSSRFLIFNDQGAIVASHQMEFEQHYPNPGWVEHDPYDLIDSVKTCIEHTIRKFEELGYNVSDIKGIGITNQRETAVVWDRISGKPLCPAIVWSDGRTAETVKKLASKSDKGIEAIKSICGLPLTTYFSGIKLRWMMDHNDNVKNAHDEGRLLFGTVDSWLIYNLTGGKDGGLHVTDVTNASRTMLMNIHSLKWSDEILEFFGFNADILPRIVSSSEIYGNIQGGSLNGVPIAGCLGDQQAALVGQKCFNVGDAKNTYGTGCFMLFNTGDEAVISKNGLLTTVGYQFGDNKPAYALEGSIAVAGSSIQFLRDNLKIINSAPEVNVLASAVKDTAGVYFVTAFSGLFAPYWRDDARGTICGITQFTTREHIARATLEASCYQTRAILDAMNADSGKPLKSLKVDGGLTNSDLCMQIQADILGIDVDRPRMRETTALGSAIAAGFAVGIWQNFEQLNDINSEGHTIFSSEISEKERNIKIKGWEQAVERSFGWAT